MSIDIEKYLKDISPNAVSGENLEDDNAFIALSNLIQQVSENPYLETRKELPSWKKIRYEAEKLLERSSDLNVLVFYLRALVKLDGFLGLQAGLSLIIGVLEKRWDTLYPPLDGDDDFPVERANILLNLKDYNIFRLSIQRATLLQTSKVEAVSYRDVLVADKKIILVDDPINSKERSNKEEESEKFIEPFKIKIEAGIRACDANSMQETLYIIRNSVEKVKQLENFAPLKGHLHLTELKELLLNCAEFLVKSLETKGMAIEQIANIADRVKTTMPLETNKAATGGINSSQDVKRVLTQVCEYYKKNEPSSPIPWLLERAMRLIGKDFLDVLNDIAPSGNHDAKVVLGNQDDGKK